MRDFFVALLRGFSVICFSIVLVLFNFSRSFAVRTRFWPLETAEYSHLDE